MAFVINVSAGGLPVGAYPARFMRAEHYTSEERTDLPPGFKLVWQVLSGDFEGQEASRIVSQKTGPKANLPKFLKSFLGRPPERGEDIDLESFYGQTGTIVVEETESGATRVASFLRSA